MNASPPHYLLFSGSSEKAAPGHWSFVLRTADGSDGFAADDVEPDVQGERLELLAVVRGLEALDQPSRVTLVTPSQYVRSGIRQGLAEWRRSGWRWECFGQMVPVKNGDLWQRVDRALRFHELECRSLRFDAAHEPTSADCSAPDPAVAEPLANGRETVSPRDEAALAPSRTADDGPGRRASPREDRGISARFRRGDLSLGKLFGLVKLLSGNRPGSWTAAAVCKEV